MFENSIKQLNSEGYAIVDNLYSPTEIDDIVNCIAKAEKENASFLRKHELFAIRQLLGNIPQLKTHLFNDKLSNLLANNYQSNHYFLSKAIYFDKPSEANWAVPYHQDLSISVDKKVEVDGYSNWTFKRGQHGVYPPLQILKDTITVRIHLDDTDKTNGAVKVITGSHLNGIIPMNSVKLDSENEVICNVKKGGAMLMKPLTLHASDKNTSDKSRRVIHLEFNQHQLAEPLEWLEYMEVLGEHAGSPLHKPY